MRKNTCTNGAQRNNHLLIAITKLWNQLSVCQLTDQFIKILYQPKFLIKLIQLKDFEKKVNSTIGQTYSPPLPVSNSVLPKLTMCVCFSFQHYNLVWM